MVGIELVAQYIDATHECHRIIDAHQLAVQPTQMLAIQTQAASHRPIGRHLDARLGKAIGKPPRQNRRADAIDHQPDRYPALRGGNQRPGHAQRNRVIGKDVGLKADRRAGRLDRHDQRIEIVAARLQQDDLVAVTDHRLQSLQQRSAIRHARGHRRGPAGLSAQREIGDQRRMVGQARP